MDLKIHLILPTKCWKSATVIMLPCAMKIHKILYLLMNFSGWTVGAFYYSIESDLSWVVTLWWPQSKKNIKVSGISIPGLEILLASWTFDKVLKRFRSFNAENLGYVGQRDAKLPSIKLWEWFNPRRSRIWADWFKWGRGRPADFFFRPPTLTASNFAALWPTALKDLNFLKRYFKH